MFRLLCKLVKVFTVIFKHLKANLIGLFNHFKCAEVKLVPNS